MDQIILKKRVGGKSMDQIILLKKVWEGNLWTK